MQSATKTISECFPDRIADSKNVFYFLTYETSTFVQLDSVMYLLGQCFYGDSDQKMTKEFKGHFGDALVSFKRGSNLPLMIPTQKYPWLRLDALPLFRSFYHQDVDHNPWGFDVFELVRVAAAEYQAKVDAIGVPKRDWD